MLETLSYFLLAAVTIFYTFSSYGFVLSELWKWFIVPTFSAEPISWLSAIGLLLVISLLKANPIAVQEYSTSGALIFLLTPWITWCMGFTLYLFV